MHISKRIGENTINSSSNNNNNNNNTRDLKKLAIIHIKKLDKINAFKKQKKLHNKRNKSIIIQSNKGLYLVFMEAA
jgi:hypothetical protein